MKSRHVKLKITSGVLAESVYLVGKNLQAMKSVGKALSLKDPEVLHSAYDA
jgi:hypothetical protein